MDHIVGFRKGSGKVCTVHVSVIDHSVILRTIDKSGKTTMAATLSPKAVNQLIDSLSAASERIR